MTAIKRALISVSDKKGIVKFASALNDAGIEIISTGGTFSELKMLILILRMYHL